MTLGERLKLVRGATSQKAFAAELRIHENTVSNAERRNSATQEYLLKLAEARNINLHWLLTGHGPMRVGESDASLLQEKISLALADALRAAYGARYATLPVETRARAMRAGANYLRAIGVHRANAAGYRGAGEAHPADHRRHAPGHLISRASNRCATPLCGLFARLRSRWRSPRRCRRPGRKR
jgi:transcriptional regulator with XRE-family HTH domain